MPDPAGPSLQARALGMIATAAIAVALIGFLTGTRAEDYEAESPPTARERNLPPNVPPARTHAELERQPWGDDVAGAGWRAAREVAAREALDAAGDSNGDLAVAVSDRAGRRAFAGAPPVIPHPVRASGAAECLACHADGFALAGRRANGIPHSRFASCTQCHVTEASFTELPPNPAARDENVFVGLVSPSHGDTAYEGAPPTVPHPTWMRESCESCHGPGGRAGLVTPHPERRSCLQCHPATAGMRASR